MKGLEALKKFAHRLGEAKVDENYDIYCSLGDMYEPYKTIEKELKALDIIKKMFDNKLCKLTTFSNDKYGILIRLGGCEDYLYITQEEHDLLKEALEC